jgi:hypothetical protein
MREFKDYDAELRALDERAQQLKSRKLQQLGELVIATGADVLPVEVLTGALISAAETEDTALREGWRASGAAFFHRTSRTRGSAGQDTNGAPQSGDGTLSLFGGAGTR